MNETKPKLGRLGRLGRFGLMRLFRVQLGFAGVCVVVAYVALLEPSWSGATVSLPAFVVATSFASSLGYNLARLFFGRVTAVLLAMAFGAMGAVCLARPKCDQPRDFAILGMVMAVSIFLAAGWLDRGAGPFLCLARTDHAA